MSDTEPWIIWYATKGNFGWYAFTNAKTGSRFMRKGYRDKDARTLVEYLNTRGG